MPKDGPFGWSGSQIPEGWEEAPTKSSTVLIYTLDGPCGLNSYTINIIMIVCFPDRPVRYFNVQMGRGEVDSTQETRTLGPRVGQRTQGQIEKELRPVN